MDFMKDQVFRAARENNDDLNFYEFQMAFIQDCFYDLRDESQEEDEFVG